MGINGVIVTLDLNKRLHKQHFFPLQNKQHVLIEDNDMKVIKN